MGKLDSLSGRAMELTGNVGDTLKRHVPDRALQWIETGAAVGALRTGARATGKFVRRNPAVAVAAVVGAGLLLYAVRRQQRKAQETAAIEGRARRIEAVPGATRTRRARGAK